MQNLETRQFAPHGQREGQISSDEEQLNMIFLLFYFILFWQCALAGRTETPMTDYFVLPYKQQY